MLKEWRSRRCGRRAGAARREPLGGGSHLATARSTDIATRSEIGQTSEVVDEDCATAQRFFAAISDCDADRAVALIAEDFELNAVPGLSLRTSDRVYRGRGGVFELAESVRNNPARPRIATMSARRYGDAAVVVGLYEPTRTVDHEGLAVSLIERQYPFVAVVRARDSRLTSVDVFRRIGDAMAAERLPVRRDD